MHHTTPTCAQSLGETDAALLHRADGWRCYEAGSAGRDALQNGLAA